MPPARGARLAGLLPQLLGVGLAAGVIGYTVYQDHLEAERYQAAAAADTASRAAVFVRGQLGEMLTLCREGWQGQLNFNYEPVALAWTRQGVDGYFLQGTETASLRQVRCDKGGVAQGPRVTHPLAGLLPAEAPAEPGDPELGDWLRAVERASLLSLGAGDLAFELLRHPVTGAVVSRAWRAGPERAEATLDPADGPAFAVLAASGGFEPAPGAAPPAPKPLPRRRWIAEPEAAFALLEREMPKGARISELTLDENQVDVTIEWPTPAFDGDPPAPYGDKTFDEYAIAGMDWWYPYTVPGFGCAAGVPLARVKATFAEAKARMPGQALLRAWYSCSTAYSDGKNGVWHLVTKTP